MILKPLLNNVKIRTYKGKYHVQLEIPSFSTLTDEEIDKIGYVSCWDQDPNKVAEGYEGSRSILMSRQKPIQKKQITLGALQISGIGYKEIEFHGKIALDKEGKFRPPSNKNFMDLVPGTLMTTSFAENRKTTHSKPKYRAHGTYIAEELKIKLKNTITASEFQLEELVVSPVEAYGRYLDDSLRNQEGQFGFMVFPVPSVNKPRITEEIVKHFEKFTSDKLLTPSQAAFAFYTIAGVYFTSIVQASRELHDKARYAHLQLHLSNAYLADGKVYLMDWATLTKLGPNRENNIINRTLDLLKPQQGFQTLFSGSFGRLFPPAAKDLISVMAHELSMEVYSGDLKKEVNTMALSGQVDKLLGRPANDFEVVAQWMKDQGIEGFPKIEHKSDLEFKTEKFISQIAQNSDIPKVGRNRPCPCGSGKKYKKCCGK